MSHAKSDTYQARRGIHALEENITLHALLACSQLHTHTHKETDPHGGNETTREVYLQLWQSEAKSCSTVNSSGYLCLLTPAHDGRRSTCGSVV